MENKANLFQNVIHTQPGAPPLYARVITQPSPAETMGGTVASKNKMEVYVLLSALPAELQQKITLAIQALQSAV